MIVNWLKSLPQLGILLVAISPTLVGASLPLQSPVQLERPRRPTTGLPLTASNSTQISLKFPPTGNRGAPKTTAGGGSRGDSNSCTNVKEGEIPLVALMPNRENVGKTATATPTLYWYIPQTTATEGEFVLLDQDKNEVYQTSFVLPSKPGVVKLSIPAKLLKPSNSYSWSFMIICDSQYRNRDKYVEGVIEYAELDSVIKSQLEQQTPLEQAKLYAENKIWFETLNTIAQLRAKNPLEWEELLKSVGLEAIAPEPFAYCFTANNLSRYCY